MRVSMRPCLLLIWASWDSGVVGLVVPKQPRIILQPALIAFQSRDVIAAVLNHLLRHLTLAVEGVSGNHFAPQSQHSSSLGSAVIPLDLASTANCPNTSRCFSVRALTGCSEERCSAWL